jgi:phage shock protein A
MTKGKVKGSDDAIQAIDNQIAKLEAKRQDLKAREDAQKRKDEIRKQILVGSYFLEKYESEGAYDKLVEQLNNFLKRQKDRLLFGLPEIEDFKA